MWFPLFYHILSKQPFEVDFKCEPFEVELVAFKYCFRWSKVLLNQKGETLFAWFFSLCKITLFSKWIFHYFFFYIRKSAAVTYANCSKFCKVDKWFWLVYMRDRMGQKNGGRGVIKERKKHFHFFIELTLDLDYWISSKNGLYDTYVTTQPTRWRP